MTLSTSRMFLEWKETTDVAHLMTLEQSFLKLQTWQCLVGYTSTMFKEGLNGG